MKLLGLGVLIGQGKFDVCIFLLSNTVQLTPPTPILLLKSTLLHNTHTHPIACTTNSPLRTSGFTTQPVCPGTLLPSETGLPEACTNYFNMLLSSVSDVIFCSDQQCSRRFKLLCNSYKLHCL